MMQLYHTELSGNFHKVRLTLSLLGLECDRISIDFVGGEHKSADFLKLNLLGQVAVLVDGDTNS